MKKSNLALAATFSTLIAVGSALVSTPAMAAGKEKCYGVAAAGQNDCATKTGSCAGTSKVDNQGDAFLAVPEGLCAKLAGGSLEPKKS
ncbi:MAG TPA: DUF2282 domain-containing protein [Psychromonas sp.]